MRLAPVLFLLPLREKVAAEGCRMRGSIREQHCPLRQPLTEASLGLTPVMPSPARGEGDATGAFAQSPPLGRDEDHTDSIKTILL
jgi:hypothetical protein